MPPPCASRHWTLIVRRADVAIVGVGFMTWVPWCYFMYGPALTALARFLHSREREEAS